MFPLLTLYLEWSLGKVNETENSTMASEDSDCLFPTLTILIYYSYYTDVSPSSNINSNYGENNDISNPTRGHDSLLYLLVFKDNYAVLPLQH